MPRRHLVDAVEHGAIAVGDHVDVLEQRLVVPARRHAGREQRLDLRGEDQRVAELRIVERLDAETVARREQQLISFVPERERELAAQLAQRVRAQLLVEVDQDLAVGARAQAMAALRQLLLVALVVVELAVHDHVDRLILVRDRLVARGEVDDREPRMPHANAPVRRDPLALAVGAAVVEGEGGAAQRFARDRGGAREHGDDSAHGACSLLGGGGSSHTPFARVKLGRAGSEIQRSLHPLS